MSQCGEVSASYKDHKTNSVWGHFAAAVVGSNMLIQRVEKFERLSALNLVLSVVVTEL